MLFKKCAKSLHKLYSKVEMSDKDYIPKTTNLPKTADYIG